MTDIARLVAVGDTAPYVEPPATIFADVMDEMAEADWRFAQVERTFSDRGEYLESSQGEGSRVSPHLVSAYSDASFDLVSLAGNHALDYGPEALLDTIEIFQKHSITTIGAGANIAEARKPAILTKGKIRVGVLGYASILLPGYEATGDSAGCAPLRAETTYRQLDYYPGSPPIIISEAISDDKKRLQADISELKGDVDFVVVSVHWGVHFTPYYVADYQREYARAAMAAGCDAIVGHGPHLIHGIEVIDNKPCIYSLGNFVMSSMPGRGYRIAPGGERSFAEHYERKIGPGRDYGHLDYSNLGLMAELEFSVTDEGKDLKAWVRPTSVGSGPAARLLSKDDPEWHEAVEFLRWSSEPFLESERLLPDGERVSIITN